MTPRNNGVYYAKVLLLVFMLLLLTMKKLTLQNQKFIGHRIKLMGKHPQAGKVGVYIRDDQQEGNPRPIIKLEETGEEVLVTKNKHWQLA